MGNPILEVSHLNSFYTSEGFLRGRKARRSQVLHDVSFTVEEGDIVGLVGESGSGKSTLARCVLGDPPPYKVSADGLSGPFFQPKPGSYGRLDSGGGAESEEMLSRGSGPHRLPGGELFRHSF